MNSCEQKKGSLHVPARLINLRAPSPTVVPVLFAIHYQVRKLDFQTQCKDKHICRFSIVKTTISFDPPNAFYIRELPKHGRPTAVLFRSDRLFLSCQAVISREGGGEICGFRRARPRITATSQMWRRAIGHRDCSSEGYADAKGRYGAMASAKVALTPFRGTSPDATLAKTEGNRANEQPKGSCISRAIRRPGRRRWPGWRRGRRSA